MAYSERYPAPWLAESPLCRSCPGIRLEPPLRPQSRSLLSAALTLSVSGLALTFLLAATTVTASAAPAPVGLGTATSFAVLGGSTVTNTGPSVISGDLGVSPGTAVVGFPPGLVINGTIHAADAVALQAQSDLTTAYNDVAGRTPAVDQSDPDVGGQTLVAGVYSTASAMSLSGTVTLDAQGDPAAVFIFQAGSTLITASNSTVALIGGATACQVFWQVGSSATLGTGTNFVGTVMALTSITMDTGANLQGRALARNGAVTLDTNIDYPSQLRRTDHLAQPDGDGDGDGHDDDHAGTHGNRHTHVDRVSDRRQPVRHAHRPRHGRHRYAGRSLEPGDHRSWRSWWSWRSRWSRYSCRSGWTCGSWRT